jgi:hypothetical protein
LLISVEAEGFEQLQNHLQYSFRRMRAKSASRRNQAGLKRQPLPIGQRFASAPFFGWLRSAW